MAYEIVVVDYHKGNLQSVARSVVAAVPNADVTISDDPQTILEAGGIILPGVGAFEDAMRFIQESGQADAIRSSAHRGTPFLGICLGLQLLFEKGSELSSDQEGSIAQDGYLYPDLTTDGLKERLSAFYEANRSDGKKHLWNIKGHMKDKEAGKDA